MTTEKRNMWIGIGVGAAVGMGTGCLVGSHITKKRCRKEYDSKLKKARRYAYIEGVNDGIEEGKDPVREKNAYMDGVNEGIKDAEHYIDNLKKVLEKEGMKNVIDQVDKMMEEENKEDKSVKKTSVEVEMPDDANQGFIKVSDNGVAFFEKKDANTAELLTDENGKTIIYPLSLITDENGNIFDDETLRQNFIKYEKNPDILKETLRIAGSSCNNGSGGKFEKWNCEVKDKTPEQQKPAIQKIGMAEYDSERHQVVFLGSGGTRISYPANLFIGPDGDVLDSIDIRNNIRKHEHNKARLNLIWSQMGWGAYIPDLDGETNEPPTAAEINNWDLNLDGETGQADDDEGLLLGDEPEEKTKERERYLDEVDRYKSHPEDAPRIISRREFGEEAYLDRVDVDYYDVENIFVESTDMDKNLDAYEYFGVTNGNDLFRMKNDADDDDPDTVYVKNFRMNCVMEVTRLHKSYESVKNGGAYIPDGSTD